MEFSPDLGAQTPIAWMTATSKQKKAGEDARPPPQALPIRSVDRHYFVQVPPSQPAVIGAAQPGSTARQPVSQQGSTGT